MIRGLLWWRCGWESACQCRGHMFELWSGKIPHAAEQLGPWATTTEPARLERVLRNKRGRDSERPEHRDEEWPPLAATRESPRTETKTQHSQKFKKKILNKFTKTNKQNTYPTSPPGYCEDWICYHLGRYSVDCKAYPGIITGRREWTIVWTVGWGQKRTVCGGDSKGIRVTKAQHGWERSIAG